MNPHRRNFADKRGPIIQLIEFFFFYLGKRNFIMNSIMVHLGKGKKSKKNKIITEERGGIASKQKKCIPIKLASKTFATNQQSCALPTP